MKSRTGRVARYLFIMFLTSLALAEGAARLMSSTAPSGLQSFYNVALPPLRPSESRIRRSLEVFARDGLLVRDPDIGWIVRANRSDNGDYTNSQGIRTSPGHLYSVDPPAGRIRIATVGDSYVYCLQVKNGETWQDYLEQMRGDIEFLNLGVPGAGTDQAFLRWQRDGRRFRPDIVILGIWPDNIFRNLAILEYYRTQMSGLALTKPRLILDEGGSARFVNHPIMSDDELVATLTNPETSPILQYDYWYDNDETTITSYRKVRLIQIVEGVWRRYQRKLTYRKIYTGEIAEGLEVTLAIAESFAREVRDAGSVPIVLMIPDRKLLDLALGEEPFPLVQRLRNAGIDVIDMAPTFGKDVETHGPAKYYVDGVGHNSPFGNQVFARYLEKELRPWLEKAKASRGSGPGSDGRLSSRDTRPSRSPRPPPRRAPSRRRSAPGRSRRPRPSRGRSRGSSRTGRGR